MAEPAVSSAAATAEQAEERLYLASQWRLMWRRLGRHRVALAGGVVLLLFYLTMCLGAEFFATYTRDTRFKEFSFAPPARVRVVDADGRLRLPFVYGLEPGRDPVSFRKVYTEDVSVRYPVRLFARGEPYLLWGLIPGDRHLIGVAEPGLLLLFGSDELGRDLYSRTLYGGRISLSIGLVGVAVSFVLGCILGGLSGFYGGGIDNAFSASSSSCCRYPPSRCGWRWRRRCRSTGRRCGCTSASPSSCRSSAGRRWRGWCAAS